MLKTKSKVIGRKILWMMMVIKKYLFSTAWWGSDWTGASCISWHQGETSWARTEMATSYGSVCLETRSSTAGIQGRNLITSIVYLPLAEGCKWMVSQQFYISRNRHELVCWNPVQTLHRRVFHTYCNLCSIGKINLVEINCISEQLR